jgi:uncharacterized protein with von Willebrand factor type A (vWA) domain
MRKMKIPDNMIDKDTKIDRFCRSVEELLKDINDKCSNRAPGETFQEDQLEFMEDNEELL